MRTHRIASVIAGVLGMSGLALAAAQISTPDIFGNHFQDRAECVVLNSGPKPLAVSVNILNDAGQTAATTNCSGPLRAGEFCSVAAAIDFRQAFACVATAPSTTNLRGTLVLHQHVFDEFFVSNLQPIRSAPLE